MQTPRPEHRISIPGPIRRRAWMLSLLLVGVAVVGCDDDDDFVDITPPAIPTGVYSVTADQQIFLRWTPNREGDLEGYSIWWNGDGGSEYELIATIDAFDPDYYVIIDQDDPSLDFLEFVDAGDDGFGLANGSLNCYAVTAFDEAGNESDLSLEYICDVPRPEGQVVLESVDFDPVQAGFDFSMQRLRAFDDPSTDVYFEVIDGIPYLQSDHPRVRLQDYGNVGFDILSFAPIGGWSATGRAEAIPGHTYAFEIDAGGREVNYAKLTIVELDVPGRFVDMDWGYQEVVNEPQLKAPPRQVAEPRVRTRASR